MKHTTNTSTTINPQKITTVGVSHKRGLRSAALEQFAACRNGTVAAARRKPAKGPEPPADLQATAKATWDLLWRLPQVCWPGDELPCRASAASRTPTAPPFRPQGNPSKSTATSTEGGR